MEDENKDESAMEKNPSNEQEAGNPQETSGAEDVEGNEAKPAVELPLEERLGPPCPFQLIVNLGGENLEELVFDQNVVTIGRGSECNVVIDNLGASRIHAQIERFGRFFLLRDMESKTGTFVRGQKIEEHCLNGGDEIFLAKHTLLFQKVLSTRWHGENKASGGEGKPPRGETKGIARQELMQTIAVDFRNMAQKRGPAPATLQFLDSTRKVPVTKNLLFFGKSSLCDFLVNGFLIGERHAILVNDQKGFVLYHLGFWKAPKVNDKQVAMAHLKEGDLVEIGDVRFIFKAAQES